MKKSFAKLFFWEYLQNLGPLLGFFYAQDAWAAGERATSMLWAVGGGFMGALLIRYTEHFIEPGEREPLLNTLLNAVFFTSGTLLLVLYYDNALGNWMVDLGIGAAAGAMLAAAQAKSGRQSLDRRHLAAMMVSLGATLPMVRGLLAIASPVPSAFCFSAFMSSIIVWMEYIPGARD